MHLLIALVMTTLRCVKPISTQCTSYLHMLPILEVDSSPFTHRCRLTSSGPQVPRQHRPSNPPDWLSQNVCCNDAATPGAASHDHGASVEPAARNAMRASLAIPSMAVA